MMMETLLVYRPLWAVLISLLAAGLIMLSDKKPNLRETWTILAAVGKLLIVLSMILYWSGGFGGRANRYS